MSKIEWTGETWNPVTGCTKVSPGCAHCYAEGIAKRLWKGRPFEDVRFHPERLETPLRWRKPRLVFVNSMSDLFHESVTAQEIDQIFDVMAQAERHVFQVLTKRAKRMQRHMAAYWPTPLPNVALGVSAENQQMADERIPLLHATPAACRFVSLEPLLGPVDLERGGWSLLRPPKPPTPRGKSLDWTATTLDWVIVGGESGPGARPCSMPAIGDVVSACRVADVPCFVKQLGARPHIWPEKPHDRYVTRDRKGADPADWPRELRVRQYPPMMQGFFR